MPRGSDQALGGFRSTTESAEPVQRAPLWAGYVELAPTCWLPQTPVAVACGRPLGVSHTPVHCAPAPEAAIPTINAASAYRFMTQLLTCENTAGRFRFAAARAVDAPQATAAGRGVTE